MPDRAYNPILILDHREIIQAELRPGNLLAVQISSEGTELLTLDALTLLQDGTLRLDLRLATPSELGAREAEARQGEISPLETMRLTVQVGRQLVRDDTFTPRTAAEHEAMWAEYHREVNGRFAHQGPTAKVYLLPERYSRKKIS